MSENCSRTAINDIVIQVLLATFGWLGWIQVAEDRSKFEVAFVPKWTTTTDDNDEIISYN